MSTEIDGQAELSARPTSVFVTAETSPIFSSFVPVASHVTFGTPFGTRP
jgi:hypothetical protein